MAVANVPAFQTVLFLRAIIGTDYNTTRASVAGMIWPGWPRKDLTKASYPRISVIEVTETGDPVAIGDTTSTENLYVLQIDIWIWDKPKDAQFLTVGGVSSISGTRARDAITREVLFEMRNHFYTDSNMSAYYDYRVRANRVIPFDEDVGILRRSIEIEFKQMDNATS